MATGLSTATANALLDAIFNATAFSVTSVFVQLHTADPGAAGTTAVATNNTRKALSCGAAVGGAVSSDAQIQWTSVPAAEDYTNVSFWDASTAGNFLCSGTITANAVAIGDTFTLPVGDIDMSFPVAS